MGVVTPERERSTEPPAPPGGPRGRAPWGLALALAAVVLLVVGTRDWLPDLIPSFPNPFAAETVDRSRPAVLQSIRDLAEYRAATGHYEVILDVERDTALPSQILGERTLFVAVGDVDAMVDFSSLGPDEVEVSDDRRTARIVLPAAQLSDPRLDLEASYVYDRQRGVLNEIGSLFSDEANAEQELYLLAEERLAEAARETPALDERAQENTRAMLESLLGSLGFERVSVEFRGA